MILVLKSCVTNTITKEEHRYSVYKQQILPLEALEPENYFCENYRKPNIH